MGPLGGLSLGPAQPHREAERDRGPSGRPGARPACISTVRLSFSRGRLPGTEPWEKWRLEFYVS